MFKQVKKVIRSVIMLLKEEKKIPIREFLETTVVKRIASMVD